MVTHKLLLISCSDSDTWAHVDMWHMPHACDQRRWCVSPRHSEHVVRQDSGSSNGSACTIHCKLTFIQQEPSHRRQTCATVVSYNVSYRSTHCLSQNMGQVNLGHQIRDNLARKKCTLIINRLDRLCSGKQKTVEGASHGTTHTCRSPH